MEFGKNHRDEGDDNCFMGDCAYMAFVFVFEGFLYAVLLAVALVCGWLLAKK